MDVTGYINSAAQLVLARGFWQSASGIPSHVDS